ncbi:uncharacterized protein [Cherax quadricarinatus]|uniref:uncharacterized protein n=1 Tax=Cherax quadricarinatus TaxID=27406 RepID=UPI002378E003|nr:uncharacterized protein LOC128690714 [Cherax quadricarinatus]
MTCLVGALLVLFLYCTLTPVHSRAVSVSLSEEDGDAQDPIIFPGKSTGSSQTHSPLMERFSNLYPSWPEPHHHASESRERKEPSLQEGRMEVEAARRRRQHPPQVEARHQLNNPWRQAQHLGYMARGQPQPQSSLWYW